MTRASSVALLAGLALGAAFPKIGLHLLVWVAIAPLLVTAQDGSSAAATFRNGLLFGIGYRAVTLYWLVYAMTRFGGLAWPIALAGAGLLVVYLAGYWALLALIVRRFGTRDVRGCLIAAVSLAGLEFVQAWMFSGFPWSLVGYAAGESLVVAQSADLAGVYGLSFVAGLVNAGLAAAVLGGPRTRQASVVAGVVLALALGYGFFRLASSTPATGTLSVALVQGNVSQDAKWDAEARQQILDRHLTLAERGAAAGADLVIWPESSWPDPYGLERDPRAARLVRDLAREWNAAMLVGTVGLYDVAAGFEVTNAAVLVDETGEWGGRYEKSHLVPFGEYLPMARFLRFLGPLVQAVGSMRPGDPDQPLLQAPPAGAPFSVAICYEIIFPDLVRRQVARGARFLVTITNDAWYGTTSAPYQHFAMARLRAIETRRWLVRAANTGITGVIDDRGRVLARTPLEVEDLVVANIELHESRSPYVRMGDGFAWAAMFCAVWALIAAVRAPRVAAGRS